MAIPDYTSKEIPYGYCHCGCGQKTKIAQKTHKRSGHIKGEPVRFIKYHVYKAPIVERFWSKVDQSGGADACWNWTASTSHGYGQFGFGKESPNAHRIAWELTYGEIPDGLEVCHNCPEGDNRKCCNPAHLFLGTHQDNMRDMAKKGRQAKGEGNGQHKLTADKVLYVRKRYAAGGISMAQLASEVGVCRSEIFKIVRGKTWKHIK